MKRAIYVFLILGLTGMLLITPVAAQTNQGLSWGVSVNDRIDFNFVFESETDSVSEAMYAEVVSTPLISDSISSWLAVPTASANWKWAANDTDIGIYGIVFLTLAVVGSHLCIPVGNWTLMTSLVSIVLTGEQITDDFFYWGISFTADVSATESVVVSARYFKSDGFLAKLTIEYLEDNTRTQYIGIVRQGIMTFIADYYLLIGVGAAVVIILAIVCAKRK